MQNAGSWPLTLKSRRQSRCARRSIAEPSQCMVTLSDRPSRGFGRKARVGMISSRALPSQVRYRRLAGRGRHRPTIPFDSKGLLFCTCALIGTSPRGRVSALPCSTRRSSSRESGWLQFACNGCRGLWHKLNSGSAGRIVDHSLQVMGRTDVARV